MSKLDRQAARGRLWGGNLSDAEVSGMVRMLTRDQIDHEVVCVTARDRINFLSAELEAQDALISKLTKQRDTANEHRDSGDFVISNAERIIAEKDALIQSMREALAAVYESDVHEIGCSRGQYCTCFQLEVEAALAQASASPEPERDLVAAYHETFGTGASASPQAQEPKLSWEDVHSGGSG